jgi:hypothetical protein
MVTFPADNPQTCQMSQPLKVSDALVLDARLMGEAYHLFGGHSTPANSPGNCFGSTG